MSFSMKRIHGKMAGEANYLIVTEIDIKMRAVISLRSSLRVIGLTTRIQWPRYHESPVAQW